MGCVALLWLSSGLLAQPGSHAYRVHVGDGGWVTPEEARARGYMLYMERWVPAKLRSQLRRWERHDARVDGYKDAYRVKSEHYRIKTNAPRMVVELEIKPFLDELYRTYVEVFRRDFGLRAKAADKNHIHIYWGFPSWRDEQGEDRGMPGFYRPGGPLTVLYDPTDPDDFHNTVFHEGAHQFFAATLPGAELPTWLDEALATYFEGCTYSLSTKKITQNHVPPDRLEDALEVMHAARQSGRPSTPHELFMQYQGDDFDADHYALAWSYLHFLIHRDDGKHKKKFARFLAAMNGSGAKSVARVYREATRQVLGEIDRGWVQYVVDLQAPPCRYRHSLAPSRAGPDEEIQDGDLLVMINGREIVDMDDLDRHWTGRDKSQPVKLLLLRAFNHRGPMNYEQRYVTVDVAPNSKLELVSVEIVRHPKNLVD